MDKVIVVGVGVLVAVGTALYYLLTNEKEEPMRRRSGPGARHSTQRSRSPPISYSDVKHEPCRKRKSVSVPSKENTSNSVPSSSKENISKSVPDSSKENTSKSVPNSSKENMSETYCPSEPDKESGKNFEIHRSLSPIPLKTQNDTQSSQEITDNNYTNSAVCRACFEPANVTLHPCKHRVFCREHAKYFFEIFKKRSLIPKCPINDCNQVLQYFIE